MRYFIICVCMLASSIALADKVEPTNDGVSPDTQAVLQRVDSAGEWLSTALGELADKMGTTVEYLWPTFVKEVFVSGLSTMIGGILSLIAGIALCMYMHRARDKLNYNYQKRCESTTWSEGAQACQVFSIIFLLAGLTLFVTLSMYGLVRVIAPEPEALNNITVAISKLK